MRFENITKIALNEKETETLTFAYRILESVSEEMELHDYTTIECEGTSYVYADLENAMGMILALQDVREVHC